MVLQGEELPDKDREAEAIAWASEEIAWICASVQDRKSEVPSSEDWRPRRRTEQNALRPNRTASSERSLDRKSPGETGGDRASARTARLSAAITKRIKRERERERESEGECGFLRSGMESSKRKKERYRFIVFIFIECWRRWWIGEEERDRIAIAAFWVCLSGKQQFENFHCTHAHSLLSWTASVNFFYYYYQIHKIILFKHNIIIEIKLLPNLLMHVFCG